MAIPLGETHESRDSWRMRAPTAHAGNGAAIALSNADRPRVLLVEDEALVGIMVQECLAECGFQTIGPVCTMADAVEGREERRRFDAAVLDINLGDGLVYQVADILAARGVPFVFVTGYDADSVDSRFRDMPVLQKPVEREMLQKLFARAPGHAAAGLHGGNRAGF